MQCQNKKEWRQLMRQLKREASAEELEKQAEAATNRVVTDPDVAASAFVLLYLSLPDELPTDLIIQRLWQMGKRIVVPVVDNATEMHLVECRKEDFLGLPLGSYGIREPRGEAFVDYEKIRVGIVPGMAFSRDGYRLGRGRGYYDRFLPKLSCCKRIGLCYQFQLVDNLPHDEFDARMDEIITPSEHITLKNRE